MNITADTVKELRDRTGAGMMDCKKALSDSKGDMEKAIDFLRKQGLAKAATKAARTASEGLVAIIVQDNMIVMTEVSCETDFVCKTDEFQNYVKDMTNHVVKTKPKNIDELLNSWMNGRKIADIQTEMIAKIGENLGAKRFTIKNTDGKAIRESHYVHAGSKIGVVVLFDDPAGKLTSDAGRDVAMHVAAMNPQYVRKSDVSEAIIAREKEVYLAQMANEKKPKEVLEKIIIGKLNKYLSEICLEDQVFIRDPSGKETVSQMLRKLDGAIKIKEFVRYQVGEKI